MNEQMQRMTGDRDNTIDLEAPSPTPANNCYERFQGIVEKLKSCDLVVRTTNLEPVTVSASHRLIAAIELGLDQLSRATAESHYVVASCRPDWFTRIDHQLDHLTDLCDELVAILERPAARVPAPVV